MLREHVAIIAPAIARALLSGAKRIETRFCRRRQVPVGAVQCGDVIHFKLSGGPLIGTCGAANVVEYCDLSPSRVRALHARYGRLVCAPARYWRACRRRPYGVLIWLSRLHAPPRLVLPRQFGAGWVVLPHR